MLVLWFLVFELPELLVLGCGLIVVLTFAGLVVVLGIVVFDWCVFGFGVVWFAILVGFGVVWVGFRCGFWPLRVCLVFGLVPDVGLTLVAVSWVSSSLWVWHSIV